MLGSPILYLKGMRIVMFQLSGFYYTHVRALMTPPPRQVHEDQSFKVLQPRVQSGISIDLTQPSTNMAWKLSCSAEAPFDVAFGKAACKGSPGDLRFRAHWFFFVEV